MSDYISHLTEKGFELWDYSSINEKITGRIFQRPFGNDIALYVVLNNVMTAGTYEGQSPVSFFYGGIQEEEQSVLGKMVASMLRVVVDEAGYGTYRGEVKGMTKGKVPGINGLVLGIQKSEIPGSFALGRDSLEDVCANTDYLVRAVEDVTEVVNKAELTILLQNSPQRD